MTDIPDLIKRLRKLYSWDMDGELYIIDKYEKERAEAAEALEKLDYALGLTKEQHDKDKAEIERLKAANMGIKRMLCKADPERYPPEDNL
jgi:hypothetical protein